MGPFQRSLGPIEPLAFFIPQGVEFRPLAVYRSELLRGFLDFLLGLLRIVGEGQGGREDVVLDHQIDASHAVVMLAVQVCRGLLEVGDELFGGREVIA